MTKGVLKGLVLAGLGLVLVTVPAAAQIKWHLGVGASIPEGDLADGQGTGFGGHGGATLGLGTGTLAVKADVSYETWGIEDTDESLSMIGVTGALTYGFGSDGAKPYILGAVGWNQLSHSADAFDATSGVNFGFGGGVNFMLGSIGAYLEARYQMSPMSIQGADKDVNSIPIVFGLRF